MKKVVYDRFGGPDVLYIADFPVPVPAVGEVLVRVHAASVGGGEQHVRAGKVALLMGKGFPRGVGVDFAGTVEALGAAATGFKPGDPVWGLMPHGQFGSVAEFVAVPAGKLSRSPANLTLVEAAALPAAGTTVIRALEREAPVRTGSRVLVRGAAGGIGAVAIPFAKSRGANVVGISGAASQDFVTTLGADDVHDYRTVRLEELGTFDIILDGIGTDMRTFRRLLKPHGTMVELAFDPEHLFRSLFYIGAASIARTRRIRAFSNDPNSKDLAELAGLVEAGTVRPFIDKVWKLDDIVAANVALERGGMRGRQIISML